VINVTNLKKLRNYLEKHVTQDKFDMESFRRKNLDENTVCDFTTKNKCGTIGCALGWAPFVKGLEPEPVEFYPGGFFGIPTLDFYQYSQRLFNTADGSDTWSFLFCGEWKDYDNSVEGVVGRMDIIIKNPDLFEV